MFKNYVKTAVRNIFRTKAFSLINIFGLAIGMAGTLLILMYITSELSFENFHKNRKHIYRVSVEFANEGSKMLFAGAMPALGPALVENFPEVDNAVRFVQDDHTKLEYDNKTFIEQNLFFADPSVFKVFSFTILEGNPETALHEPYSLVITEEFAQKLFGEEQALGKTLLYNSEFPVKVTGIIKDIPANTHLRCDYLMSFSSLESLGRIPDMPWNVFGDTYTYLLLKDQTNSENFIPKIHGLLEQNTSENFANTITFDLLKLTDIHMKSKAIVELGPRGNLTYVYVFSSVAGLLLLIACFNFMNLSTARSLKRKKEVGMRKVLGAKRSQLIRQFLGESLIITLLAVILAIILFELFYPVLNTFLENSLTIGQQNFLYLFLMVPLVVLIVGVMAGSYPAFYLSKFSPIHAFADRFSPILKRSAFRNILVITQFTMAIILLIGTTVIFKQLNFMKNSDLGFNKDNVVLVNFRPRAPEFSGKYSVLLNQFQQHPQVLSVSGAYTVPGRFSKETKYIQNRSGTEAKSFSIQAISVDFDYVTSMGMKIVDGRNFSRDFLTDEGSGMLLNQEAVRNMRLDNPVGTKFLVPGSGGPREMAVVGIIKDFHVYSLKEKIEPLMLYINPNYFYNIAVRIQSGDTENTLAALESTWNSVFPGTQFEYDFLESSYNRLYLSEEKIGQLLTLFSGLGIFVACLGLFGLTSYMTEQRHKEIGIRKVLGADISKIVFLLSKDFTKSVLLANLFAWPIAYYAASLWLKSYAYRININPLIFLTAGAVVLTIALLTVSFQAIKAALANPVDTLKYE
ncbi:MAG: ABC transporter permease [Candidatus Aminicenantes bacterium]|nr:ABC transporter permease [Candidatus Aminicenantes bacterium]